MSLLAAFPLSHLPSSRSPPWQRSQRIPSIAISSCMIGRSSSARLLLYVRCPPNTVVLVTRYGIVLPRQAQPLSSTRSGGLRVLIRITIGFFYRSVAESSRSILIERSAESNARTYCLRVAELGAERVKEYPIEPDTRSA